jgi:Uma2 family endonuclease
MANSASTIERAAEPGPKLPDVKLVETDGMPLESDWHRDAMNLLIEQVRYHIRHRRDYFVGGNMFIYFNLQQARNRDFRGPDFFFVNGVSDHLRDYWVVWEEGGRYPDVIIELLSESTANVDRTTKKAVYERTFRTPDYFCYDPETLRLEGWRLAGQEYQPLKPNEQGRLWCAELGLWLGTWEGPYQNVSRIWLRFFDPEGRVVPLFAEAATREVETEKQRAETAEAEVARLKTLLSEKSKET